MKFGAEPKKTAVLAGLVLVGGYFFYENVIATPGGSEPSRPVKSSSSSAPSASALLQEQAAAHKTIVPATSSEEWLPSLKPKRPEDRVDPMTIDPTLRRDLLAKVQAVESPGASRNLFQYGAAPPPLPKDEPIVKMKQIQAAKEAAQAAEAAKGPPPPPPPPPILLKYYGYSTTHGENAKHAFFLDGDDILVAAEGEVVKKRYRVVKIGINSVVMEDTQFKHEQTLQLAAEANG